MGMMGHPSLPEAMDAFAAGKLADGDAERFRKALTSSSAEDTCRAHVDYWKALGEWYFGLGDSPVSAEGIPATPAGLGNPKTSPPVLSRVHSQPRHRFDWYPAGVRRAPGLSTAARSAGERFGTAAEEGPRRAQAGRPRVLRRRP